ncbi:MAG: HNH endonuclease [Sedimentisphaerales bacterium]|nr:HNH endonuclease [Sedimentisphaerales bacterium]
MMATRLCLNCVYARVDGEEWLRAAWQGAPMLVKCANHPCWPGELREVTGTACPNYVAKCVEPKGDVKCIPLTGGQYALVDASDYEWLSQYTWRVCGTGYAARAGKGREIYMHREIMDAPEGKCVDHIDGNRRNNCRANLRLCTRGQNMRNQKKHAGATSRFKGVYFYKRIGKWAAALHFKGQRFWLGSFVDEVEAARTYDAKAVELFGEFARLNFPEEWPAKRRAEVYARRGASA